MSSGGNFDKEFEATLMSTFTVEDESNNEGSPIMARSLTRTPTNAKSLRDRANSLYTIGLPPKQQLNFLTTPIFESTENLDQEGPTPAASIPLLQNAAAPVKKLRRLNTLLLEALKSREVAEIERLILAGANPNATCSVEHISACHIAAMRPDSALAMLIYHGVEKNRVDRSGRTPLHLAAYSGELRQMAMLLGFSKELIDEVSRDMTYEVAAKIRNLSKLINDLVNVKCSYSKNELQIPKEWLDSMTDHDCKEFEKTLPQFPSGWTPLHAASARAKADCCRLLLIAGADPSIRDMVGRSPLDIVGSTYYSEENIDAPSFAQIVAMLAGERSNITLNTRKTLDTPLHTAVELNSIEAVKILLGIHLPLTWLNKAGLTPLHICVKKKYREMLQILVSNRIALDNDTNLMPAVDVMDKDGNTVLQYAVLENWEIGVCVALEAEANVAVKNNNGDTALHMAAEIGNIEILNEILTAVPCENIIDVQNSQKESPLMKAVRNGHTKCVKRLLEEKASVKILLDNQVNVFHIAAEKGFVDVLQVLLDDNYTVTRAMINYLTENEDGFGPIHYAVQNNHLICVKLLLSRNAFRSLKTSLTGKHDGSTPLHLAAKHNHVDIAKVIIKNNPETLDITNSQDWTALHTASYYGSRDVIVLLLKEGANLAHIATGSNKKEKNTSLDLIMSNITKPTEFLKSIFDDYITTNDCNIQDPNCKVTVNFQALVPKSEGKEQMKVIESLLKTGDRHGQRNLLVHPLLESFLHLKWRALLPFFYSMIIAYGVYVALLTIYVLAVFSKQDNNAILEWVNPQTLAVVLYVTCFFVVALEALYVHIHYMYFLQIETWIKFGSIMLALSLPKSIATTNGEQDDYPRHIATISLLLCWLEMMFLLSRFPKWGYYVLMFGKVCCTVLKIILTFAFLLMGFSLSFMIQFHHNETFHDTFASIVKVLVMMTSEFDYGNLMDYDKFKGSTSVLQPITVFRCMFLLFLIITAIVLMNLMVGVAVNDLHYLQVYGNVRRLTKQVEFLVSFDRLLYNRYVRIVLPKSLEKVILKRKTILNVVTLRPSDTKSEYYKKLPSEIREAIFETAHSRMQQKEDEIGSQTYKKKLDEIHEATVKKKPKIEEPQENTTKFINFGLTSRLNGDNNQLVALDSGILDGDNQNSDDAIAELKSSIAILEMKIDMIVNRIIR